ncbi:MAG: class I adenylate-forming enzyme family protein [Xanthobacteraceae bacterium]
MPSVPEANLTDAVMVHAAARPHAVALVEGPQSLTYGDLGALLVRATTYLRRCGVAPGERTGIAMMNGIDHIIVLLALMRMGAVPVELPAESGTPSVLQVAHKYRIGIVLTDPDLNLDPAGPGGGGPADGTGGGDAALTQVRINLDWRTEIAALPPDAGAAAGLDTLNLITLTGGSTGIPTGVVNTHRQLLRRVDVWVEGLRPFTHGLDGPPLVLLTAPARYAYFFFGLLAYLCTGGTLVLMPEFARGIDLLRAIAAYPDAFCFVTANICRFFLAAATPGKLLLPRLRLLEWSGQPLMPEEKRAVTQRVTPHVGENYGSAGAGRISNLQREEFAHKAHTVGRPLPGMEVQIVDPAGIPVGRGEVGRLRCRAASLASGPCPEDAATTGPEYFRDGWYYPGDLCSQDDDGYLILKGRGADVVRRQGVDVFTADIEAALMAHPSVRDAAVIGRPSQKRGEEIVAFLVPSGAPQHEDIANHCRAALAPDRWPDHVFYIDVLPRNAAGKVERPRLRILADARLAQNRP